jgi:DtxR family Mn-dependent transcriptional regulator
MSSVVIEDYLREIWLGQQRIGRGEFVSMSGLSSAMGVTPGTATAMVQSLAEQGYILYQKRNGSRLTEKGEDESLRLVRRHRLLEYFLARQLGMNWSEVHEEAHRLEHGLSDRVLDRLDEFLGFPTTDPHGDPIPNAVGGIDRRVWAGLAEAPLGKRLRVVRILDQDPAFLRFCEGRGLTPDSVIRLVDDGAVSGALSFAIEGKDSCALGSAAARSILIEILS